MNLQINDKMRALLVKEFAETILASKDIVVVFSKDTTRTNANNGDLTNSSLDSVYNDTTIEPIYVKNLSDDTTNTEIKIGGLKSKLITLDTSEEEITIGGVDYLFVDLLEYTSNFDTKYSDKNVTSIYLGNPEVIVTNSRVYNTMSILLTTDVDMTTKDFTTGSPTITPLDGDKTDLIAQVLPADAWMPDSNADNKELKVVINL